VNIRSSEKRLKPDFHLSLTQRSQGSATQDPLPTFYATDANNPTKVHKHVRNKRNGRSSS